MADAPSGTCTTFVQIWDGTAYSAGSFIICYDKPDLGDFGWDNKESSFKNLNGKCSYHYRGYRYTDRKVGNCAPEGVRDLGYYSLNNAVSSISQTLVG